MLIVVYEGLFLKVFSLVQCDPDEKDACDAGCNGGLMTNAYKYVMEAGGLETETDYPYKGTDGKCKYDSNKIAAKVTNFTNIPVDENQIAAYLVQRGPLASKAKRLLFPFLPFLSWLKASGCKRICLDFVLFCQTGDQEENFIGW